MTERVKILDHHISLVSKIVGDKVNRQDITRKIRKHYIKECNPSLYPFTRKHPLRKFVAATVEIAIAIKNNTFESIPSFVDGNKGQRNFDKICFNCPNHNVEKESCRLDQEGIWKKGIHSDMPRNR